MARAAIHANIFQAAVGVDLHAEDQTAINPVAAGFFRVIQVADAFDFQPPVFHIAGKTVFAGASAKIGAARLRLQRAGFSAISPSSRAISRAWANRSVGFSPCPGAAGCGGQSPAAAPAGSWRRKSLRFRWRRGRHRRARALRHAGPAGFMLHRGGRQRRARAQARVDGVAGAVHVHLRQRIGFFGASLCRLLTSTTSSVRSPSQARGSGGTKRTPSTTARCSSSEAPAASSRVRGMAEKRKPGSHDGVGSQVGHAGKCNTG